ncbi:MAG: nucleotidyltransferase family protein [Dehalococcoidia bacterium]|nr:nucleotidyltransferase family protein [Dehalococcoidia bacterium]MCA9853138.1 nucleotidyltransferase family protein [Dehalococcoidia bacterium]
MECLPVRFSTERLNEICERYNVERLSLFGSVLRDDFTAHSDVDVLVAFRGGRTPGLYIVDMRDDLEALFGRTVDIVTEKGISPYFRASVLAEARAIYDAA